MKKKSIQTLCMSACLAGSLLSSSFPAHADTTIYVTVDGELLNMDQPPIIDQNSRTLVPVRFVSEALGVNDIKWDQDAQKATFFDENHKIEVTMNQPDILVNGQTVTMDTTAQVVNGRSMIPARYIAEALGATVGWDEASNTVTIQRTKPQTNNLDKYGLKVKQNLPISLESEGLKVTLNSIYVYPYDSPAAKTVMQKYQVSPAPSKTPKYVILTNQTIENQSSDVIRYDGNDLMPKAQLIVWGFPSLKPVKSDSMSHFKVNDPEYLTFFKLQPGEKISGPTVYFNYYDLTKSIYLSNDNGRGTAVIIADNK
jgi:hypothetical protein